MKKIFLLPVCLFFCFSLFAQDIIIKRNGQRLEVEIAEVTPNEVKYKMPGDPQGPTITLIIGYVHKIIYERGGEQIYAPMYKDVDRGYNKRQNPGMAVLFSILLPGGGQYYNKDYFKGGIMTFMYIAGPVIAAIQSHQSEIEYEETGSSSTNYVPALMLSLSGFVWSVIDAPVRASIINHRYGLAHEYTFETKKLGLKIEPYFATQTTTPAMQINQAFPVYGAKMSITFK